MDVVEWVATMKGSVAWRAEQAEVSPETVGELVVRQSEVPMVLAPVGRGWHDILRDCGGIGYDAATAYWETASDEGYQKLRGLLLETPAPFQSVLWTTATRLHKVAWKYRSVIRQDDYGSPSKSVYAGASVSLAAELHDAPQNTVFNDNAAIRMTNRYQDLAALIKQFLPRPILTMAKRVDAAVPTTIRSIQSQGGIMETTRPDFVNGLGD